MRKIQQNKAVHTTYSTCSFGCFGLAAACWVIIYRHILHILTSFFLPNLLLSHSLSWRSLEFRSFSKLRSHDSYTAHIEHFDIENYKTEYGCDQNAR